MGGQSINFGLKPRAPPPSHPHTIFPCLVPYKTPEGQCIHRPSVRRNGWRCLRETKGRKYDMYSHFTSSSENALWSHHRPPSYPDAVPDLEAGDAIAKSHDHTSTCQCGRGPERINIMLPRSMMHKTLCFELYSSLSLCHMIDNCRILAQPFNFLKGPNPILRAKA